MLVVAALVVGGCGDGSMDVVCDNLQPHVCMTDCCDPVCMAILQEPPGAACDRPSYLCDFGGQGQCVCDATDGHWHCSGTAFTRDLAVPVIRDLSPASD